MPKQTKTAEQFEKEFERLIAHEMADTTYDDERAAKLAIHLAGALGRAIAHASRGNQEIADKFMTAAEGYIAQEVTHFTPIFGKLRPVFAAAKNMGGPTR